MGVGVRGGMVVEGVGGGGSKNTNPKTIFAEKISARRANQDQAGSLTRHLQGNPDDVVPHRRMWGHPKSEDGTLMSSVELVLCI